MLMVRGLAVVKRAANLLAPVADLKCWQKCDATKESVDFNTVTAAFGAGLQGSGNGIKKALDVDGLCFEKVVAAFNSVGKSTQKYVETQKIPEDYERKFLGRESLLPENLESSVQQAVTRTLAPFSGSAAASTVLIWIFVGIIHFDYSYSEEAGIKAIKDAVKVIGGKKKASLSKQQITVARKEVKALNANLKILTKLCKSPEVAKLTMLMGILKAVGTQIPLCYGEQWIAQALQTVMHSWWSVSFAMQQRPMYKMTSHELQVFFEFYTQLEIVESLNIAGFDKALDDVLKF